MRKKSLMVVTCCAALLLITACSTKAPDDPLTTTKPNVTEAVTDTVTPVPTKEEKKEDESLLTKEEEEKRKEEEEKRMEEEKSKEEETLFQSMIASVPLKAVTSIQHTFTNASVHDPSILKVDDTYYIFGSHLAVAKSNDLMNWEMVDSGVSKTNKIIPDAMSEMEEAFTWAKTNTFWAPDVIQLADGRFYMYYCNCEGSSPLSALGVAVSDNIEGPYKDLGIILKSGMTSEPSENGDKYDARVYPNVVDPCVFFDKEGRLWMMYGSYSGGIYILELNSSTGFPLESGYGKKLLGANHLRIEGAFVEYSKETDYYYMFLSYGGLSSDGGYNIRVCRSENPDGPYLDYAGNDMVLCRGSSGSFFDDRAAEKYGTKLMGNWRFQSIDGEESKKDIGYVSPGHNSTIYDDETGKYFLIFHTRFEGGGERHQVRTHQMFLNEDGWFVVAPYRYTGETIGTYTKDEVVGAYKIINHQHDISNEVRTSENIILKDDQTIVGAYHGTWELQGDNTCILTIDGVSYLGVFLKQWDENNKKDVMTFSVLSQEGVALWGSGYEAK